MKKSGSPRAAAGGLALHFPQPPASLLVTGGWLALRREVARAVMAARDGDLLGQLVGPLSRLEVGLRLVECQERQVELHRLVPFVHLDGLAIRRGELRA